jgi:hypothetical protein
MITRLITVSGFTPAPLASGGDILKPSNAQFSASIIGTAYYDPEIDPSASTSTTATTTTAG